MGYKTVVKKHKDQGFYVEDVKGGQTLSGSRTDEHQRAVNDAIIASRQKNSQTVHEPLTDQARSTNPVADKGQPMPAVTSGKQRGEDKGEKPRINGQPTGGK